MCKNNNEPRFDTRTVEGQMEKSWADYQREISYDPEEVARQTEEAWKDMETLKILEAESSARQAKREIDEFFGDVG